MSLCLPFGPGSHSSGLLLMHPFQIRQRPGTFHCSRIAIRSNQPAALIPVKIIFGIAMHQHLNWFNFSVISTVPRPASYWNGVCAIERAGRSVGYWPKWMGRVIPRSGSHPGSNGHRHEWSTLPVGKMPLEIAIGTGVIRPLIVPIGSPVNPSFYLFLWYRTPIVHRRFFWQNIFNMINIKNFQSVYYYEYRVPLSSFIKCGKNSPEDTRKMNQMAKWREVEAKNGTFPNN